MKVIQPLPEDSPQSAVARPAPPISDGGARAAIAARLAGLGHAPGLLEPAAVDRLVENAKGSHRKLRATLDTTLFLAAAEHVARVDEVLVERALLGGVGRPPAFRAAKGPSRRAGWYGLRATAGLAVLALGLLVWNRSVRPLTQADGGATSSERGSDRTLPKAIETGPTTGAATERRVGHSADSVQTETAHPKPASTGVGTGATSDADSTPVMLPKVGATKKLETPAVLAPTALPPLSPAVEVGMPAVPPGVAIQRPPGVLIFYTDSPGVGVRLASLSQRLRQVGVGEVTTRLVSPGRQQSSVAYFTDNDLMLARRVISVLKTEGWPGLRVDGLAPNLARRSGHRGLIELRLP